MYTALPSTITNDHHETESPNPILEDLVTESTEIIADYIVNSRKIRNEISYDEWFKLVLKYCVSIPNKCSKQYTIAIFQYMKVESILYFILMKQQKMIYKVK